MTLFLGIGAINTGNNLIYLIVAALLGLLLISGIFGKRNIAGIDVEISVPEEIYAGMRFPVSALLVNRRKRLPAFLMRVVIDGRTVLFPFVEGKGQAARLLDVTAPERGLQRVEGVHISSVFPFNFFVRSRKITKNVDFVVFPRPSKYGAQNLLTGEERYRNGTTANRKGDDSDIISLRDYLAGDPLKYIDWKASARTGTLKTKELAASLHPPVIIDVEKISGQNVEENLSAATFLILDLIRNNKPVGLKIGERLYKPDLSRIHKLRMLSALALYGKGENGDEG